MAVLTLDSRASLLYSAQSFEVSIGLKVKLYALERFSNPPLRDQRR